MNVICIYTYICKFNWFQLVCCNPFESDWAIGPSECFEGVLKSRLTGSKRNDKKKQPCYKSTFWRQDLANILQTGCCLLCKSSIILCTGETSQRFSANAAQLQTSTSDEVILWQLLIDGVVFCHASTSKPAPHSLNVTSQVEMRRCGEELRQSHSKVEVPLVPLGCWASGIIFDGNCWIICTKTDSENWAGHSRSKRFQLHLPHCNTGVVQNQDFTCFFSPG